MKEYREIMESIYTYYPKNCSFEDKKYKATEEHMRYETILKDTKWREKISNKIYKIIQSIFISNYITKWTNNEYPSIHYSVLLHKNQSILDDDEELLAILNGKRLDLELYVSLLDSYYYLYVIETLKASNKNEWKFNYYNADEFVGEEEMNLLTEKLLIEGFSKIDRNIVHKIVPYIETELHYAGEVKIFHCLFSDVENMF